MIFNECYIGIISVDKTVGEKVRDRVKVKLKLPEEKINVYVFERATNPLHYDRSLSTNHQIIVRDAFKKNYKYVLVFEDDVEFYENVDTLDVLHTSFTELQKQKGWEIYLMGGLNFGYIFNVDKHLQRCIMCLGLHAYIMSREGMEKFIKADFSKLITYPIINFSPFQNDCGVTAWMKTYISNPQIAYQSRMPRGIKSIFSHFNENDTKLLQPFLANTCNYVSSLCLLITIYVLYKFISCIYGYFQRIKI